MSTLLESISPTARALLQHHCAMTCGGCGHIDSIDRFTVGQPKKQFQCPNCRRMEVIHDAPATRLASGFLMPGKRTVTVIEGRKP